MSEQNRGDKITPNPKPSWRPGKGGAPPKAGPKHHPAPKLKERPASKGRVRKGKSRA